MQHAVAHDQLPGLFRNGSLGDDPKEKTDPRFQRRLRIDRPLGQIEHGLRAVEAEESGSWICSREAQQHVPGAAAQIERGTNQLQRWIETLKDLDPRAVSGAEV